MPKCNFDQIEYQQPYFKKSKRHIKEFIGLDTETYPDGEPFLAMLSDGREINLNDFPRCMFSRKYQNGNFVVYNLKFDSGSLLYHLPRKNKRAMLKTLRTEHDGYIYHYIPHKLLRITRGKNAVSFWDIYPFYELPADTAARKYLRIRKRKQDPGKFTRAYVKANREKIKSYCLRDAEISAGLANELLDRLHKFGIYPNSLYSVAAVGFQYFKNNAQIIDVWKYWQQSRDLLRAAYEAYRGGKFEMTARGQFDGYVYDIKSAYPYEIGQLQPIQPAIVTRDKKYQPNATYSFLRCYIRVPWNLPHTIGIIPSETNIYPCGDFYATITKAEYEYLVKHGSQVEIFDAWHIKAVRPGYPYRKVVNKLYRIKEKYKREDPLMSGVAKLMLNSFYGKMIQVNEHGEPPFSTGAGFNPIYAAVITANVRLRVTELQRVLGKDCLAVHTDSVITTRPLPNKYLGSKPGAWELQEKGSGVIIANGIYEIGRKICDRGFMTPPGFSWKNLLAKYPNKDIIKVPTKEVISWLMQTVNSNYKHANQFIDAHQELDLNADVKRGWPGKVTGRDLLNSLQRSFPKWSPAFHDRTSI